MRVLFDVSHPAHVHLFKNAIVELQGSGNHVLVTSRDKDLTTELLDAYDIDHTPISANGDGPIELAVEWTAREFRMVRAVLSFDPDVIVSRLNPPAAHASVVARCPNIVFDDSDVLRFASRITHPFSDKICTPANYDGDLGARHQRYDGIHELAYLHPNRFTPDKRVLREFGIAPDETYSVLRFVSWGAHHDVNQEGLSMQAKRELVEMLDERGAVYITAEDELPAGFEAYRLPVPPAKIHQLMYHANLYVGDSQTMATEAAILGTPAVRCNSFAGDDDMSNFVMLESEYGLLKSTTDEAEALETVRNYLDTPGIQEEWADKRERLGEDMIDVTSFMLDVIKEAAS